MQTPNRQAWRHALLPAALLLLACTEASAQVAQVNTIMTNVQTILQTAAPVALTIATIWAGFKMAFQHAKWSEVSNIVIGGILVGGAAQIASWLMGS